MKNTKGKRKSLGGFFLAFLITALAFLAVGLGTLGSAYGTGDAYELRAKLASDDETPGVTFYLSDPKDASGNTLTNVRLVGVYLNVATVYGEEGYPAKFRVQRSSSGTSFSSSSSYDAVFENFYTRVSDLDEQGKPVEDIPEPDVQEGFYRFVSPFKLPETWKVRTYRYLRLTLNGGPNVLLNEVVFVGEKLDADDGLTGERYLLPAEVREATPYATESAEEARLSAGALLDAQIMPGEAISSFDTFGRQEIHTLMTVSEMRRGNEFAADRTGQPLDVCHIDNVNGSLGTDLIAFGTLMFGMSPFGLRIFPMLAAFGALIVLARLITKLMKSEKAGFVFALLYALSCLTLGYGHLGTPLMIGVFFFACALSLVFRFYSRGIAKASFSAVLPLLFGGLFGAAAICVNGAFVIPVAGVVALFVAGMVRQQTAKRYRLEKAEGEETAEEEAARSKAQITSEFRFKNRAAAVLFPAGLILGAFLLSLLGMLPMYFTALKAFDSPASPTMNVFLAGWRLFANGFTGVNYYGSASWIFKTVFSGTGAFYAVTALVINPIALAAAIFGAGYGIGRLIALLRTKERGKEWRGELRRYVILLAGLLLSLIAALSVGEGGAFVLLAYLFGFLLAATFFVREGNGSKAMKVVGSVGIALLAVGFLLLGIFVFSVPLPAGFLSAIL